MLLFWHLGIAFGAMRGDQARSQTMDARAYTPFVYVSLDAGWRRRRDDPLLDDVDGVEQRSIRRLDSCRMALRSAERPEVLKYGALIKLYFPPLRAFTKEVPDEQLDPERAVRNIS